DDLQVVLGVDQRRERGAQQRLIVDDQDPGCHITPSIGTWAVNRKPRTASGSAPSRPPNAAIRSRIPTIPCPGAGPGGWGKVPCPVPGAGAVPGGSGKSPG